MAFRFGVGGEEFAEIRLTHEGQVAVEHGHRRATATGLQRELHRMARAPLLFLHGEAHRCLDATVIDQCLHRGDDGVFAMAHDDVEARAPDVADRFVRGLQQARQHGLAAHRVQHFGQTGLHAGTLPRREDDDIGRHT